MDAGSTEFFRVLTGPGGRTAFLPEERPADAASPSTLRFRRAETLEFVTCDANQADQMMVHQSLREADFRFNFSCIAQTTMDHLDILVQERDVGILVQSHEPIGLAGKIVLTRTRLVTTMNRVDSPVLVPRGTFPYESILYVYVYVITRPELELNAAILAIDAARIFDAKLTVAVAAPPDFVSGSGTMDELIGNQREVRRPGSAYGQRVETAEIQGNPVHSVVELSAGYHSLVLGHPRSRRSTLLRPSVEQNPIHRAPCSVLAIPH